MSRNTRHNRATEHTLVDPSAATPGATPGEDRIAQRAYEKWVCRGCPMGDDQRDWFEAQQELSGDCQPDPKRRW